MSRVYEPALKKRKRQSKAEKETAKLKKVSKSIMNKFKNSSAVEVLGSIIDEENKQIIYTISSSNGDELYTTVMTINSDSGMDVSYSCDCGEKYKQPNRNNCKHIACVILHSVKLFISNHLPDNNQNEINELFGKLLITESDNEEVYI